MKQLLFAAIIMIATSCSTDINVMKEDGTVEHVKPPSFDFKHGDTLVLKTFTTIYSTSSEISGKYVGSIPKGSYTKLGDSSYAFTNYYKVVVIK